MYNDKNFRTANPLSFGLAMTAGIGIVLMILVLGVGVLGGADEDSGAAGMAFVVGLMLMIVGIAGWIVVTRPFDHFDDINQPAGDDHHADAHAADAHNTHDETALVPHTAATHDEHGHPTVADDAAQMIRHGTGHGQSAAH